MILQITFADSRKFMILHKAVEANWDIVNSFVKRGDEIRSVLYVDSKGHQTEIPTEVFDGKPVSEDIRLLQNEVEQILRATIDAYRPVDLIKTKVDFTIQKIKVLKKRQKQFREKSQALLNRLDDINAKIQALKKRS